jgi:hypothetical protein
VDEKMKISYKKDNMESKNEASQATTTRSKEVKLLTRQNGRNPAASVT